MADIKKVESGRHDGKDGFIITYEMIGITKADAMFRAVPMTAMRFPTTITEAEVVGVTEFGDKDFDVRVFVPTEGFLDAGIGNPVGWVRDQFKDRFMG